MFSGCVPSVEDLYNFHAENFKANNVVLGASGVNQSGLVSGAEPMLASLSGDASKTDPSIYGGGEFSQYTNDGSAHVFVGFGVNGGWKDMKRSCVQTVISYLMGAGASFSSGGPGKGMHSRLYRNVLQGAHHLGISGASYEISMHDEQGFAGVLLSGTSDNASKMADLAVKELIALGSGAITEEELNRAKATAIASTKMILETPHIISEDLAKNYATWKKTPSVDEFAAMVGQVSKADIEAELKAMIATPLTYGAIGKVNKFPTYRTIESAFK